MSLADTSNAHDELGTVLLIGMRMQNRRWIAQRGAFDGVLVGKGCAKQQ